MKKEKHRFHQRLVDQARAAIKLKWFLFVISRYLLEAYLIKVTTKDSLERKRKTAFNVHKYSKKVLRVLNVHLEVHNPPNHEEPFLYVGNHLGFIDIFSLAAIRPFLFVTSYELKETPLVGHIAEIGGCIFVERRNRQNIINEMKKIGETMSSGFSVVLYPEATAHNGEEVLPFKRTLMVSAAHAGVPIIPGVFNFKKINKDPFTIKWRDHVCYYGEMTFAPSFWKTLQLKEIHVELEFLPRVHHTSEEQRAMIADSIRDQIVQRFKPVIK